MLEKVLSKIGYTKKTKGNPASMSAGFTTSFNGSFSSSPFANAVFGGETIQNGICNKVDYNRSGSIDYYSLRTLSRKVFVENPYAGMALGRLCTNVINEGLKLEAIPSKLMTGFSEDENIEWSTKTEELFKLWASDKSADWEGIHNFAALQKVAYMESLVEGDVLRLDFIDKKTKLPAIKLVPGRFVANGTNSRKLAAKGNTVTYGVERDKQGRHIAYHVLKRNKNLPVAPVGGTSFHNEVTFEVDRILAKGKTSNRQIAQLIYETPPPVGMVRGFPLLTRIIQRIDQLETYATYEIEAAKVNSAIAAWVEKTEDKPGSNPLRGVAQKVPTDPNDPTEPLKTRLEAGLLIHELAHGEKIQSFKTDRPNVNFGGFKETVIDDIAATLQMPPEILLLKFGNNFSASRQAVIEFKAYVRQARQYFSDQFTKPVYKQFLQSMVIRGKIKANDLMVGIASNDIFVVNGWTNSKWIGFVKQNVDILKEAKAYEIYLDHGLVTREQAASELTEVDYRSAVDRLTDENALLSKAKAELPGTINTTKSEVEEEPANSQVNPPEED